MNYSEMTDYEINMAVSEALQCSDYYDYCNSWADAGLIIQGRKISINAHGLQAWMAWKNTGSDLKEITSNRHQHSFISESPLRAAMVVFLMLQEKPDAA